MPTITVSYRDGEPPPKAVLNAAPPTISFGSVYSLNISDHSLATPPTASTAPGIVEHIDAFKTIEIPPATPAWTVYHPTSLQALSQSYYGKKDVIPHKWQRGCQSGIDKARNSYCVTVCRGPHARSGSSYRQGYCRMRQDAANDGFGIRFAATAPCFPPFVHVTSTASTRLQSRRVVSEPAQDALRQAMVEKLRHRQPEKGRHGPSEDIGLSC
ncbi:hypothetical protein E4U58_004297 [Claviceps cyperi]|nr:hypothetical protein E4U58_004297 [Claviceps cyperi]